VPDTTRCVASTAVYEAFIRISFRRGARSEPAGAAGRIERVIDVLIRNFLQMLVTAVWLLVLGRVLLSWCDPSRQNRVSQLLIQATEPILSPVRRLLPRSGMFDLSAFVVLIVLGTLMRAIARA